MQHGADSNTDVRGAYAASVVICTMLLQASSAWRCPPEAQVVDQLVQMLHLVLAIAAVAHIVGRDVGASRDPPWLKAAQRQSVVNTSYVVCSSLVMQANTAMHATCLLRTRSLLALNGIKACWEPQTAMRNRQARTHSSWVLDSS